MVFLAETKEELKRILYVLKEELAVLRLELKGNWQIFPVDVRGIDFLGYRFYHGRTLVRKRIKQRIFKRLGQLRRGEITLETFEKSMASWDGWLMWADAWRLRKKIERLVNEIKERKKDNESIK